MALWVIDPTWDMDNVYNNTSNDNGFEETDISTIPEEFRTWYEQSILETQLEERKDEVKNNVDNII